VIFEIEQRKFNERDLMT